MSKHSDFHLSFFQMVSAWRHFTVVTKLMKNFKSLYGFGDAVSKLETFVWILSHVSRSITWSLFTLKASYLVKWPISTWSFMWWCQFIDWLKFESHPSSLLNFGTAYRTEGKDFMNILPVLKSCCTSGVETGVESNILYTDVYLSCSKA